MPLKSKLTTIGRAWKQTFDDFFDYKLLRMSAALAYYTIFAIVPMLIIIIYISSAFASELPHGTIHHQVQAFVGHDAAVLIENMISSAVVSKSKGVAQVVSIIALVFSATGVFTEIQDSINVIWRLKAKPKKGWLKLIINRLLSFSIIVSLGFILLVSLLLNAILAGISDYLYSLFPQIEKYNAYFVNQLLTFVTTMLLFGIIFKVLPDARIKWKDVLNGALITAILFMLGKFGISYYIKTNSMISTYGAAGSVIIILVWVYYSAIILYIGAAYTHSYAKLKGRAIFPNQYAVWVERVEKDLQKESLPKTNSELNV